MAGLAQVAPLRSGTALLPLVCPFLCVPFMAVCFRPECLGFVRRLWLEKATTFRGWHRGRAVLRVSTGAERVFNGRGVRGARVRWAEQWWPWWQVTGRRVDISVLCLGDGQSLKRSAWSSATQPLVLPGKWRLSIPDVQQYCPVFVGVGARGRRLCYLCV